MLSSLKITEIFCSIDDFCQEFVPFWQRSPISNGKKRIRSSKMYLSEIMTVQVLFHFSGYRTFKDFYTGYVREHLADHFPDLVSYNRMVELKRESFMPLAIYLKTCGLAHCTGISFVDSTPLRVCDKKRINQHKVFKELAKRGQCSLGWFYGFKLHIVTNDQGGIIDFMLTGGMPTIGNHYASRPLSKNSSANSLATRGIYQKNCSPNSSPTVCIWSPSSERI